MRLYIKLIALIAATVIIQKYGIADSPPSELWFGLRCSLAYAIHDDAMIDRLTDEARQYQFGPVNEIRVAAAGGG